MFLEGKPIVGNLKKINIGDNVEEQFNNDLQAEHDAVKAYNDAIRVAAVVGDNGTHDMPDDERVVVFE